MPTRADRHLRSVKLAKECADLGARVRTIHKLTGLPPRDIQRIFFTNPMAIPRGRPPASPEWYHGANLLFRTDASIFATTYQRLRCGGFRPEESLLGAYRQYQRVCPTPPRISFDRAFDLASHTDGIWIATAPSFSVVTCPCCSSAYLCAMGAVAQSDACPFCKLVVRFGTDARVQSSFPARPLPHPSVFHQEMLVRQHLARACHRDSELQHESSQGVGRGD